MAVRTLIVGGYAIDGGAERHPSHIELRCEKASVFGVRVRFLIAITDTEEFTSEQLEDIRRVAEREQRAPVFVGKLDTEVQLGWQEFLLALGGEVPSWRALAQTYASDLVVVSKNALPPGRTGEAWLQFEDMVCDGLEFSFGHRAWRMGGRARGARVSDIVAVLPSLELLVVDAKATGTKFDASWPHLRALVEYVKKQQSRQQGLNLVQGALVVSAAFKQRDATLQGLSRQFLAETRVPVAFMTAETLAHIVTQLQATVDLRAALAWKRLFAGGLVLPASFDRELNEARAERIRESEY